MNAVSNSEELLIRSETTDPAKPFGNSHGRLTSFDITRVDPLSGSQWDVLVRSHPSCSFFHSAAWARVLSGTYAHRPFYLHLAHCNETGGMVPIMEVRSFVTGRRGVCLPFTDLCGPLISDQAGTSTVIKTLAALGRERSWKYVEVRGSVESHPEAKPSAEFFGHTLNLAPEPGKLLESLASPVRRAIRKAERSGATVQITRTAQGIKDFYRLHVQTRRRHGLPPQPLPFFLNIHEEVIKPGAGFVVLATDGGRPVAGAVFFHLGKKAIYKFGASIHDGKEIRANNLVIWEGIKFLSRGGYESLHFGRTSRQNQGLRRFKLGWGTNEEMIQYFRLDPIAEKWMENRETSTGFHNAVFSRMPLVLNRIAGAMIYPHLD